MSQMLGLFLEQIKEGMFGANDTIKIVRAIKDRIDKEWPEQGSKYDELRKNLEKAIEDWEKP